MRGSRESQSRGKSSSLITSHGELNLMFCRLKGLLGPSVVGSLNRVVVSEHRMYVSREIYRNNATPVGTRRLV